MKFQLFMASGSKVRWDVQNFTHTPEAAPRNGNFGCELIRYETTEVVGREGRSEINIW